MMKLAVVGSRSLNNYSIVSNYLDSVTNLTQIISGGAKGADKFARIYAKKHNIDLVEFKPDWAKYGKSAGYKRNKKIISACDEVVAFWDGVSKGTTHSFKLAQEFEKPITIIRF